MEFLLKRGGRLRLNPVEVGEIQICPELNANDIQIPYDKHHKVSSLRVKSPQNTHNSVKYGVMWKMSNNPAKYEALMKQDLRSILDIVAKYKRVYKRCKSLDCGAADSRILPYG